MWKHYTDNIDGKTDYSVLFREHTLHEKKNNVEIDMKTFLVRKTPFCTKYCGNKMLI